MIPEIAKAVNTINKIEYAQKELISKKGLIPSRIEVPSESSSYSIRNDLADIRALVGMITTESGAYSTDNPLQKKPRPPEPPYIRDPIEMPVDTPVKKPVDIYQSDADKETGISDVPLNRITYKDEVENTPNVSKELLSLTPPPLLLQKKGFTREDWSQFNELRKVQLFMTYYEKSTNFPGYDPFKLPEPPNSPERNAPQPPSIVRMKKFDVLGL